MKTKLLMTAIAGIATLSATSAIAQIESLREVVYYNFNSAQSAEVEAQMQKITDLANNRGASNIRVTCHTDTTGSAAYNQALSERRAADVLNALVSRGISRNIISSQGLGETSLLVPTGDGVKEQLNRRCEIDLDVQPQFVQQQEVYQQPVQQEVYREYVPQQTQTQTVEEFVRAPDPTPIEPTTVTRTIQSTPQAITSNVPTQQVVTPRVITPPSAPSVPSLPRVPSTGGIFSGGVSPLLAIGGIGAAGAIGAILADGDSNETELAAAEAAASSAQADAAAAAAAQADAEAAAAAAAAAQAEAEAAQAEAEAALEEALAADDEPSSP